MTIYEKYYAMNRAINVYLVSKGYTAPVYKYGSVPHDVAYPYFQSMFRIKNRQPHGTSQSGTLTDFEYYLNFFTAARHERENDSALFIPFEVIREAIVNPQTPLWKDIANVYEHKETPEFEFKGGREVLQRGLIFDCQTVTTHIVIDEYTETTIDDAVEAVKSGLDFE